MARFSNVAAFALFVVGAGAPCFAPAFADPAAVAPAASAAFTTAGTTLGVLLDNPATAAVVLKYLPKITENPQLEMARGLTLKQIQAYAPDKLTDDLLAKIDADLAQVPAPR